ncbi:MAG: membrane protein YdbS with pleckstrin-like domain [Candidatus Azotimanducaceae bacterium]|jgi:membrane protein YdbS with pleckstrin-like domain
MLRSNDSPYMTFTNVAIDPADLPTIEAVAYQPLSPAYPSVKTGITALVFGIGIVVFLLFAFLLNFPLWIKLTLPSIVLLIAALMTRFALESARVKRFAIREHDILFESGVFWRSQTIQPLNRVQHVEISSGPIDKRFGLAEIHLFSSGSGSATYIIPGLPVSVAEDLREFVLRHRR